MAPSVSQRGGPTHLASAILGAPFRTGFPKETMTLRAPVRTLEHTAVLALCASLVVLAACANDARRPRGGGLDGSAPDFGADFDAGPGRDGGGVDLGSVDLGAAMDAGRDAGPPPLPMCNRACTAPSDCGNGSPATDTNNYACTRGVCAYLGCRDDAECRATFGPGGGEWLCR